MQKSSVVTAAILWTLAIVSPYAQNTQPATQNQKPEQAAKPESRPEVQSRQAVNIKLELTITDQTRPGESLKKAVRMVVADRDMGSIRSLGSIKTQGRVQLNIDARPTIVQSGAIRLSLGLEYNPRTLANDASTEWSSLNEQIGVVLEPGKAMIVSQAADPASDRVITVEVKATVLK